MTVSIKALEIAPDIDKKQILHDYRICIESREASILGRKEVFLGKANFGIFGDGKEVAQVAMAKVFKDGDYRAGYYRDQTFMFATGIYTLQEFFAQLYADTNLENEPASGGRLMNAHFGTRFLDKNGKWKKQTIRKNITSDISTTSGQMPRLLGLAYASRLYRQNPDLQNNDFFSNKGNEVAFGTIGDAAAAEGNFFEAVNAAGVLQVPMLLSVWDDGYGISVPVDYQITKGDISGILSGFQSDEKGKGFQIYKVPGWDYEALCKAYQEASYLCRSEHIPVLLHVYELTQPQGHSTSGSHERYKSKERLEWEKAHDCNKQFREWILENDIASSEELNEIENNAKKTVKEAKNEAWKNSRKPIEQEVNTVLQLSRELEAVSNHKDQIKEVIDHFNTIQIPYRSDIEYVLRKCLWITNQEQTPERDKLKTWYKELHQHNEASFSSQLYSNTTEAAAKIKGTRLKIPANPDKVDGREVLKACFDKMLEKDERIFFIGEDIGFIGGVNQALAGLQNKYGELRISDTGIREATIIGQGIGAAMRGLRPVVEIQYLDYLLYGLDTLSDDLASLRYRTRGGQKAPVIIRTRGHRHVGVWHAGSPLSTILGSLRGIYVLTPRNMTQAAGFYNTMTQSDDPALIIECLNGYRLKENMPENIGEYTVPLGIPEILHEGHDITIVTYGFMCKIIMDAVPVLEEKGISCEVIDVQTLSPFDVNHTILESLKKTSRIIFADEDVPGGASAYMMQQVLENQGGYRYLDSDPKTISAKEHRTAYGVDGEYFTKPTLETVFETAYAIMNEADPRHYPDLF